MKKEGDKMKWTERGGGICCSSNSAAAETDVVGTFEKHEKGS